MKVWSEKDVKETKDTYTFKNKQFIIFRYVAGQRRGLRVPLKGNGKLLKLYSKMILNYPKPAKGTRIGDIIKKNRLYPFSFLVDNEKELDQLTEIVGWYVLEDYLIFADETYIGSETKGEDRFKVFLEYYSKKFGV